MCHQVLGTSTEQCSVHLGLEKAPAGAHLPGWSTHCRKGDTNYCPPIS